MTRPAEATLRERDLWLVALGASLASRQFAETKLAELRAEDAPDDATVRKLFAGLREDARLRTRNQPEGALNAFLEFEGVKLGPEERPLNGMWRLLLAKLSKRRFSEAIFRQRAEEETSLPRAIAAMREQLADLERLANAAAAAQPKEGAAT